MKVLKERKYLLVLLALLVVFAACKGESPTAPTAGGGGGGGGVGGGSGTPPVGATITLTVSNANPLVSSTALVTATVTSGGNPVPNGTAVEFDTSVGQWTDTGTTTTIRTTTNGVATATLTSATPGAALVTAIVNNVTKQITVTFQTAPTNPPPTNTAPTITSLSPNTGSPAGGQTVTITGTNFRTPVRVVFDLGGGVTKEAFVVSVTPTQIQVVTPSVNLGAGQTLDATVLLFNEAGTPNEQRVSTAPFTFRVAQLTPKITTVSPDSGPVGGGTRITIFGEGFEAPVQVGFSSGGPFSSMTVLTVTFDQITAVTPTASDVTPGGSGVLTGPVDLRVLNINSSKSATLTGAFRYTPKLVITAMSPGAGSALGGTRVTIDGSGFDDPITVSFAGVVARPVRVSGTQIVAITSPVAVPCSPPTGVLRVSNVNNGDGADGPPWVYNPEKPLITGIAPPAGDPGVSLTVTVAKPGVGLDGTGLIRFTINGNPVFPVPNVITDPVGPTGFVMTIPDVPTFPTTPCTVGGVAGVKFAPVFADVVFLNVTTGCTDTVTKGLKITPPAPNACTVPPTPPPPSAAINPATFCPNGFGNASVAAMGTSSQLLTIRNTAGTGAQPLTFTTAVTGPQASEFTLNPGTGTVNAGSAIGVIITFKPTAVGLRDGTLTIFTNDPANATFTVCLEGTGTP